MIWILILLLPLLCGVLLYLCFRTRKTSDRVALILGALACAFTLYAAANPIPGSEGPGLLAWMFAALAAGALLVALLVRVLPKPLPALGNPAAVMNGWLLGAFLLSPIACFAVIVCCGTNFEGAALSVVVAAPLLWGFLGWLMPRRGHPALPAALLILLGWTLIPGGLFYLLARWEGTWATVMGFLCMPHREMAPVLFHSLFYSPQSAFGLEVLRPLAIGSMQGLLAGAFGVGMLIKEKG